MPGPRTPPSRKQIPRVVATPVVERALPAVEHDVDLISVDGAHCRRTQQLRVFPVDRFQLHSERELVRLGSRRLLANIIHQSCFTCSDQF